LRSDDCSTVFSEAYEKQREDVIMDRGRDCLFFGAAPGDEDGAGVRIFGVRVTTLTPNIVLPDVSPPAPRPA
jgi:hypothetical protein